MSELPLDDEITLSGRREELFPNTGSRLQAVLTADGLFSTHRLPNAGTVTVGRAAENELPIEHRSVSRIHARITIGPTLTIEDLGSRNGTRVAGAAIEPNTEVPFEPGDAVEVGGVLLVVQRLGATQPPRRIRTHDYFEARVEEECARRSRSGGTFAVLRINVAPEARSRAEETFASLLRAHDVIAAYAPSEYELLLDADVEQATLVARRVDAALASAEVGAQSAMALYPKDGVTAEALIARACALVRGRDDAPRIDVPASPAMDKLRALVERVAASTLSVLILGETGVGKEVLAKTIHRLSPRAERTFLGINCAALTETLLESELFGHERGAFTGAQQSKPGLLEAAEGGTVFLDELGELPMSTQVKLLRVIEERTVLRVGSLQPRPINVRFVAATNRDLEAEIARGRFRQDLYFRLNSVTLVIPPLRERVNEIEGLARAFIAEAAREATRQPTLSRDALVALERYSWPGNIRELRNVIERAVLLAGDDGAILPDHLPLDKMRSTMSVRSVTTQPARDVRDAPSSGFAIRHPSGAYAQGRPFTPEEPTNEWPAVFYPEESPSRSARGLRDELEALERQRILDALERCGGNQTQAARLLGISRGTLLSRLNQYDVTRPRKPRR